MEWVGWLGNILLAICGFPQAVKSIKEGHSRGITWGLLILWLLGEILTLIYVFPKELSPLIFNYAANIIFLSIIIRYKIWERK